MNRKKPLVGITGMIGSGKSTAAQIFADLGCPVFNSDQASKEITQEQQTLQEILEQYGIEILDSDGQLDRKKLAEIVFQKPKQLQKLNQIIHPKVRKKMWQFVEICKKNDTVKMIIFDSPLIYETDLHQYLDYIIVVAASEENCIKRVQLRNNLHRREILARMTRQIPLQDKIKKADFIIYNDHKIAELLPQVKNIYAQILAQWSCHS